MITPLTGRNARIGTALQTQDGNGVNAFDAPVKVVHLAKIATSNLKTDAKKVMDDSLNAHASETEAMVVGTSEPDGDVEFNIQEEGATADLLTMHYGSPVTTNVAAVAAGGGNPAKAAYYDHVFKNTNDFRLGTIVEQVGAFQTVYWGSRVSRLSLNLVKTQDRPIFIQASIMALNSLLNKKATAGTDTGMSTAAKSGTPIFGAVRGILTRAGSQWAGAREFGFQSDAALARTEDLDGYRGMAHHCPDGKKVSADVTLYFSTEAEYRRFTGNSATDTEVFGPGWDIVEEDVELIAPGAIRNLGTTQAPSMFQPLIGVGLLRGVYMSPLDRQIGKNAIMLKINIKPMQNDAAGTDSYVRLRNLVTNANLIAAGNSMPNVPANAGSAFSSGADGTAVNVGPYSGLLTTVTPVTGG